MTSTRNETYAVIAAAVGAVAGVAPAYAQESGKVMIDVADCIKLAAPEARLACYESRVAAVFGERAAQAAAARPAASPAALVAASVVPAAPPSAAAGALPPTPATTGLVQSRSDRQSRRQDSERAAANAAANDIVGRVKDLHEVLPNAWQITLDDGQVWRQTVSKRYELRLGAQVKIYTTHWGSAMRLSTEDLNGYIQVERVN